ncbi:UDP-3-O-(3-hydroxymyristoyl)glucosamine N-acyltransferase [Roseococcus sp. YIM B11640]|uniref:UDP-3-O-(3-hydroxymyristoyl)glucosamine N-acyltransferase n=1 Tax=Roseococcus sp. YIM B11640 TaxID=3133973 RepID=UPI003C7DBC09
MSADTRFFEYAGPLALSEILSITGGSAARELDREFVGVSSLDAATKDEVSFCESPRYASALRATRAGAVIVSDRMQPLVPESAIAVVAPLAALAFARLALRFHPEEAATNSVHPSAVVADDAVIGADCEIGPFAVISPGVVLGERCRIGPFAMVGRGVVLGDGCVLHAHASISHAICAAGVILHPGARVGQAGFGFVPTPTGKFETSPQLGLVELGEGVEIGANSCVDRGALGNTVLGSGTRLDNLVQIGHNVRTGRGCILVSQVGISGSTILGDFVTAGGQAGFTGHISVGSKARIAAQAGVISDVPPGMEVFGTPALPAREAFRSLQVLKKLTAESRLVKKREAE